MWWCDGASGGWDCGVAVACGGCECDRAVGVGCCGPAPGRGVFNDVVVRAVRDQAGEVGLFGFREWGCVVAVAFAGGAVAAWPGADGVPGEERFGDEYAGVVAGGGGF